MYVPSVFAMDDVACLRLMREHSFAMVVTASFNEIPEVTHLPLDLQAERGEQGTLIGHIARNNPHALSLTSGRHALAVFQGAHGYVSPGWYETADVPTWDYLAVHVEGRAVAIDEATFDEHLRRLVAANEDRYGSGWSLDALPQRALDAMKKQVVGFEIVIEKVVGKAKLSQNRSAADRQGVLVGLRDRGDAASLALAEAIVEFEPR